MYRKCDDKFSHYSQATAEWWGLFMHVDSKWLELWRFPNNLYMNESELKDLNNSLITSPNIVNIRDVFFLVAKITDTSRFVLRAMKSEQKQPPVLREFRIVILDGNETTSTAVSSIELTSWDQFVEAMVHTLQQPIPPESLRECFYD